MKDTKVSDLMTTAVVTVQSTEDVSHADAEMRLAGIRHLPVLDDHHNLVGILSSRDLMIALARAGKTVRVSDVMSRDVKTVEAHAHARRAAAMMLEHRIGALPVTGDEGQLVGIITETDFLRVAHELLGR